MATVLSLPSEIIDAVCAHLPSSSLPALALSSSTLCAHAQRTLFRHISVSPVHRNLAVVPILAKRPHLAQLVRSFTLSIPPDALSQHDPDDGNDEFGYMCRRQISRTALFRGFYTALAQALRHTTELSSLALLIDPRAAWVLPSDVPYAQLERLACTFTLDTAKPCPRPADSPLGAFLVHTPALRELEIESGHESERVPGARAPADATYQPAARDPLPCALVPRLTAFTGSPESAARLVPGRPVARVHLLCASRDLTAAPAPTTPLAYADAAVLARLAESTAAPGVQMLNIATGSAVLPFLEAVSTHLPALVHLQVGTTYTFGKAWDAEFYDDVAHVLGVMPALSTFELSGMCWPCGPCLGAHPLDSGERGWRPAGLPLSPPPPEHLDPADHADGPWTGVQPVTGAAPADGPQAEYDFFDYLP